MAGACHSDDLSGAAVRSLSAIRAAPLSCAIKRRGRDDDPPWSVTSVEGSAADYLTPRLNGTRVHTDRNGRKTAESRSVGRPRA